MAKSTKFLPSATCARCGALLVVQKLTGLSARASRLFAIEDHHRVLHDTDERRARVVEAFVSELGANKKLLDANDFCGWRRAQQATYARLAREDVAVHREVCRRFGLSAPEAAMHRDVVRFVAAPFCGVPTDRNGAPLETPAAVLQDSLSCAADADEVGGL